MLKQPASKKKDIICTIIYQLENRCTKYYRFHEEIYHIISMLTFPLEIKQRIGRFPSQTYKCILGTVNWKCPPKDTHDDFHFEGVS